MIETDVLIVGGSLVGLSAATCLAWHGVPTLSVERHDGTAIYPRAGHFHLRTLEVLRSVGLEARVRAASEEQFDPDGGINAVESLAGKEIATYIANLNEGVAAISPSTRLFMTQQSLEPLIRNRAEELGAKLRYATELVSFEQDAGGVTGHIRNVQTGATDTVRAKYMIAADGNRSPIRERLGIRTHGPGHLADCVTIYFHADCGAALRGRNLGVIYVFNPDLRGFFRLVRTGNSGFLAVMTLGDMSKPDALKVAQGITDERCIEFVHSAIGLPEAKVEIEDIASWRAVAEVAERFTEGRVFWSAMLRMLCRRWAASAATPAFRTRTIWPGKSRSCSKAWPGPDLLATYNDERQPIGELAIQQAYTRYVLRVVPERGKEGMQPPVDDLSMEIGYRYHSPAIVSETVPAQRCLKTRDARKECRARARRMSCCSVPQRAFLLSTCSAKISACSPALRAARTAKLSATRPPISACRSILTGWLKARLSAILTGVYRCLWLVRFRRGHGAAGRLCCVESRRRATCIEGDAERSAVVFVVQEQAGACA